MFPRNTWMGTVMRRCGSTPSEPHSAHTLSQKVLLTSGERRTSTEMGSWTRLIKRSAIECRLLSHHGCLECGDTALKDGDRLVELVSPECRVADHLADALGGLVDLLGGVRDQGGRLGYLPLGGLVGLVLVGTDLVDISQTVNDVGAFHGGVTAGKDHRV